MRRAILLAALSTAFAAEPDVAWIQQAGGMVTRDGARIVAIDFRSGWVTDSDIARLARLPDLRRLDLSLTRISDRGLRALKQAASLEDLNLLFAEQVSDESTAILKSFHHLKRLNLRGTKITDSTLEFLESVPTLESLDIGWAQITDTGLDHLVALTSLRSLSMGGNKLTDTALQFLRQMPQLEYLDVGGTQRTDSGLWSLSLGDAGVSAVAAVSSLRELRLAGTAINTRQLSMLKPLGNLKRLNLQGCKRLKDDAVAVLAELHQLESLDLKDSGLSESAVTKLRVALPSCQILY